MKIRKSKDPFKAWLEAEIDANEAARRECGERDREEVGRGGSSDYYDEAQRRGGAVEALIRALDRYKKEQTRRETRK